MRTYMIRYDGKNILFIYGIKIILLIPRYGCHNLILLLYITGHYSTIHYYVVGFAMALLRAVLLRLLVF